jgi:hypothetical protein
MQNVKKVNILLYVIYYMLKNYLPEYLSLEEDSL